MINIQVKNKMKNRILLPVAVCATAVLAFASCQKENNGEALFTATIESAQTNGKTVISSTGAMSWSASGDHIAIYGDGDLSSGVDFVATRDADNHKIATFRRANGESDNVPQGTYYYAKFPCDLTTAYNIVALPEVQNFNAERFDAPMYAKSSTRNLPFKNVCGVLQLNLNTSVPISSIVVNTPNKIIAGNFVANYDETPVLTAPTEGGNTVTLNCNESTAGTYYIYLPPQTYTSMTITINAGSQRWVKSLNSSLTINQNNYYTINFTLVPAPEGAINGLFSVGDNKQVWFSKGNLQYDKSADKWSFMEHQWNTVETDGQNVGTEYANQNVVSLFGWGTSGWTENGWAPNHYNNYHPKGDLPTATIANNFYYGPRTYDANNTSVNWGYNQTYNLEGDYADADWAWHNVIYHSPSSSTSSVAHTWRTLSQEEWDYLISTRQNASAKKGCGTVNGKHGLILLPDVFSDPKVNSYSSDGSFSTQLSNYTENVYDGDAWTQMEDRGALFLPAAGRRNNGGAGRVDQVGGTGMYHSTTSYVSGTMYYAYMLVFFNANPSISTQYNHRYLGCSVRAVQDYNASK